VRGDAGQGLETRQTIEVGQPTTNFTLGDFGTDTHRRRSCRPKPPAVKPGRAFDDFRSGSVSQAPCHYRGTQSPLLAVSNGLSEGNASLKKAKRHFFHIAETLVFYFHFVQYATYADCSTIYFYIA
jgi:hypothetical protein